MSKTYLLVLDPTKVARHTALRGWLRTDLAKAAGVSPNPIVTLFKGKPISPRTAGKVAAALGVKIIDLVTETPQD